MSRLLVILLLFVTACHSNKVIKYERPDGLDDVLICILTYAEAKFSQKEVENQFSVYSKVEYLNSCFYEMNERYYNQFGISIDTTVNYKLGIGDRFLSGGKKLLFSGYGCDDTGACYRFSPVVWEPLKARFMGQVSHNGKVYSYSVDKIGDRYLLGEEHEYVNGCSFDFGLDGH